MRGVRPQGDRSGFGSEGDAQAKALSQSNAGYSGTALWKLKRQGTLPKVPEAEDILEKQQEVVELIANVIFDAASSETGILPKPLVRHVLIRDLRKVAARSRVAVPQTGLFMNVPVSLFALFDGQSCAEVPGPQAAEFCAKHVHQKLLRNLSALPPDYVNDTFLKATLLKTFEDLDKELLENQPGIKDGCGGALALLVGEKLFTAVVGHCDIVLCDAQEGKPRVPVSMGSAQGRPGLEAEKARVEKNGGWVMEGGGGYAFVRSASGASSAVSRSIGDRAWKGDAGGVNVGPPLLIPKPETSVVALAWAAGKPFILMCSAPVAQAVTSQDLIDTGMELNPRPRAVSGVVAAKAAEALEGAGADGGQCTVVTVYFLPGKEAEAAETQGAMQPPPAKKAKTGAPSTSVRLRHILVRHRDCGQPHDPVRNKPVLRTAAEADAMLRVSVRELLKEQRETKRPADAKKAAMAHLTPSPTYIKLCKEMSECSSASKGGGMMGDLGWLSQEQLRNFGSGFAEAARGVDVGQWSDVTASEQGVHIFQRIA